MNKNERPERISPVEKFEKAETMKGNITYEISKPQQW